jgi:hypothetical protein
VIASHQAGLHYPSSERVQTTAAGQIETLTSTQWIVGLDRAEHDACSVVCCWRPTPPDSPSIALRVFVERSGPDDDNRYAVAEFTPDGASLWKQSPKPRCSVVPGSFRDISMSLASVPGNVSNLYSVAAELLIHSPYSSVTYLVLPTPYGPDAVHSTTPHSTRCVACWSVPPASVALDLHPECAATLRPAQRASLTLLDHPLFFAI